MSALSWFELSKCPVGTRVVFVGDYDIFPECLVPAGTGLTIEENGLNEIYCAMILRPDDERIRGSLSVWDGMIHLAGPWHPNDMREWLNDSPVKLEGANGLEARQ